MSNKNVVNRTSWNKLANYLALFLVFLGILVRTVQYLSNRSLWGDEVNLALNIIDRSYGELSQTLDYAQSAPLGFLWLEKFATQLWGNSEYALRLLPFVSSIISLVVFYRLVRQYSSPWAAPIAIALFACGRYTLYFATELKPYSSDVAIALILFWLLVKTQQRIFSFPEMFGVACLGGLAIWFSYPSVLVLAALSGWILTTARNWHKILLNRLGIYLIWLVSFGLFYLVNVTDTLANEDLSSAWSARYPDSLIDILWLFDALGKFFYHPMGFLGVTDGIGIFAFIVGCVAWYRHNRTIFLALIAPFVVNIIAAYLHQYPFRDRLILFLAPLGMMIVAEGIVLLLSSARRTKNFKACLMGTLGVICLGALTVPAIYRASNFTLHPELKHEVQPVLTYVAEQNQPGDKVYVYVEGNQAFLYYMRLNNYSNLDYINGTINFTFNNDELAKKQQDLGKDLQSLRGQRVWFIIRADANESAEILDYLDRIGQRENSFQHTGASAYLYSLSNN